jgi:YVTN family beta-propeller protein
MDAVGGAMRRISFLVLSLSTLVGAAAEPTPSPALLVLNKADNAIAILNPTNGNVVATIPVGRNPHEAAVSDDGKLAFASNMQGNSISVIDLVAQKELHRVALPNLRTPHGLHFADGKLYFTAESNQSICALRSSGESRRLDVRLRPERHPYAGHDERSEQDFCVKHGFGQR